MTVPTQVAPATDVNDIMAGIANVSVAQSIAEQSPSDRDERGRFAPRQANSEQAQSTDQPLVDGEQSASAQETTTEVPVMPEGYSAVPSITRPLATTFTVTDAEGAIEPPDLTIEFTANGKSRREPLDKVVKLAQFGVYNHEKQQQAEAAMQQNEAMQTQMAQYDAALKQLQYERHQLLTNDQAYLNARATFEQQNTPEARLQMEREQVQLERQQIGFQQAQQAGTQFLDTKVEPALELIASALPTVSKEELAARVLIVANKYTVQTSFGSIINPQAHSQIAAAIRDEVVPWAQQLHDHRNSANAGNANKTQALQVEAQRAKNLAARSMRTVSGSTKQSKPKPVIKTLDDAISSSIQSALESVGVR